MSEKTSLEKSHSKSSNAKLTIVCILGIFFFGALWAGLLGNPFITTDTIRWIIIAVGGAGSLLTIVLLAMFKR